MATITTRSGKGSALTHTEMDNNFTNLNTDKAETSLLPSGNIVGDTDTQTLTNKTLTSPVVNTPDINGGTLGGVTVDGNLTAATLTITPTELSYLDGATSNIQTQINNTASRRGALVTQTAAQSIPSGIETAVVFASEDYDTDSIHDNVTNNSRLTVPSGVTKVRLHGRVSYGSNSNGNRWLSIYKGGSIIYTRRAQNVVSAVSGGPTSMEVSTSIIPVSATEYFELICYQDSASAINIGGAGIDSFSMEIIE